MYDPTADAILQAAQLGRLDFASLLLGAVAILIALAAVFAFLNVRGLAKAQATEVAERVGREVAENAANKYLQAELFDILASNLELLRTGGATSAGGAAEAQRQAETE